MDIKSQQVRGCGLGGERRVLHRIIPVKASLRIWTPHHRIGPATPTMLSPVGLLAVAFLLALCLLLEPWVPVTRPLHHNHTPLAHGMAIPKETARDNFLET